MLRYCFRLTAFVLMAIAFHSGCLNSYAGAATVAFATNSGGGQYTDTAGNVYQADTAYSGGNAASTTATITGTADPTLYQSERYGNFSYNIPLADGNYTVTLKFAEIYWNSAGKRVFNVSMQGRPVITNLDIFAQAGKNAAYDVSVPVSVTNGILNIAFTSVVDYAKVSAILVTASQSSTGNIFATNSGGGQYTDTTGNVYQADTAYSGGYAASTTAEITGTADPTLYQSERYGNFSYNIPLADGNYTVTLKFAEIYWNAAGKRVFNVSMQGAQVISNLDIFAQAGKNTAYDVSVPVSVTNGMLNIAFTSVVDYAKVSAIAVSGWGTALSPDTTAPTVPAGLSATIITSSQITLAWSASTDPMVAGQITSGMAGYNVYRNGSPIGSTAATKYQDTGLTASTTYSYTVSAYDAAGNGSAQSGSVSATTNSAPVIPPSGSAGNAVFAVHAGGGQYTDTSGNVYQQDTNYSGGNAASTTAAITGTADPTLYQSERYGNFSYNIPLADGNYTVTLKFAEIYWNAAGQRVFNVSMQGRPVIANLDIFAQAGKNAAYDVSIPVSVTNGMLNIIFTSVVDFAKVSAILVTASQSSAGNIFAINSGGGQYTDTARNVYQADTAYSGGNAASTTAAITGTADPTLYQSERYGNFSYNIPLADGNYTVTLKFAEIYWNAAGKRVFNVSMQGQQVISDLDIFAQAGKNAAYNETFPVTVINGMLTIAFTTVVDSAKVSAIAITEAASPGVSWVSLNPVSVAGGNTSQGSVTLNGAAPGGGAVVSLISSNPAVATVPSTVNVAAGDTNATFNVTTYQVSNPALAIVSATYGGITQTDALAVQPANQATSADWSTFGYDLARTGFNPNESILGVSNASKLHLLWSFDLGAVTVVEPAVALGVMINGTPTNVLYIGSEHGDFYALNADTGALIWHEPLGSQLTACTDMPDEIFGVSGTPTLDRAANLLYVVGGDGKAHALNLATGAEASGWPVAVTNVPATEHVYGGVTVLNGKLYAEIAGYCDLNTYFGKVVEIDFTQQPQVTNIWYPAGGQVIGGGIWGPGGVSIDPSDQHVFTATGNGFPETYLFSDSVVELSNSLAVLGTNYPGLTGLDADFGATPILFQPPGCQPMVAAKNKTGVLVVYTRGQISNGPLQRLQIADVNDDQFNGIPAWSPLTNMLYIGNSSDSSSGTFFRGMLALKVQGDCTLALAWQQTVGPNQTSVSPPTVANGVVYYGDGYGNTEFAFNAATGTELWNSGSAITGGIYAAPAVVNGKLYVGAWDHKLYAFGP